MKRPCSSDSLGALMSMCPNTTDEQNHVYSTRDFQSMLLDEEGCIEEFGHVSEKKRRLSVQQVKALEKNFEVENKLEPERKVKLAQELGLQPRQVAVWFQNRRARWKTKQLERDYGVLKSNFDALKHNYESLKHDNEALLKELRQLKSKLYTENGESRGVAVKEEAMESESDDNKLIEQSKPNDNDTKNNNLLEKFEEEDDEEEEINFENFNVAAAAAASTNIFVDHLKDGSSDSDSSAILNDDSSPNAAAISSSGAFLISTNGGSGSSKSSDSLNFCFQFTESSSKSNLGDSQKGNNHYQPQQYVKMEEHNFFNGEESCSTLFTDEQAPTLQWYCPEDWIGKNLDFMFFTSEEGQEE